jgi:hypothetical protein
VFEIEDDLTTYKSRLKETNLFHSFNGKPAIVSERGDKYWYINGKLHQKDGPALVDRWGDKYWYIGGKRHRENGPAIEWANGDKSWYINGKRLTEQEFNEWRKNNENRKNG